MWDANSSYRTKCLSASMVSPYVFTRVKPGSLERFDRAAALIQGVTPGSVNRTNVLRPLLYRFTDEVENQLEDAGVQLYQKSGEPRKFEDVQRELADRGIVPVFPDPIVVFETVPVLDRHADRQAKK